MTYLSYFFNPSVTDYKHGALHIIGNDKQVNIKLSTLVCVPTLSLSLPSFKKTLCIELGKIVEVLCINVGYRCNKLPQIPITYNNKPFLTQTATQYICLVD